MSVYSRAEAVPVTIVSRPERVLLLTVVDIILVEALMSSSVAKETPDLTKAAWKQLWILELALTDMLSLLHTREMKEHLVWVP